MASERTGAPALPTGVDCSTSRSRDAICLRVHAVFPQVLGAQRLECVEPDPQRQRRALDVGRLEPLKDAVREMEAGGGGGGRTGHPRVHGLVPLRVIEVLLDVWRKGYLADLRQQRLEPAGRREAQDPDATGRLLDDIRPQRETELQTRPRVGCLTRTHEAVPNVFIFAGGAQQQDLGVAAQE